MVWLGSVLAIVSGCTLAYTSYYLTVWLTAGTLMLRNTLGGTANSS
jgi:hypothetical protein